MLALVVCVVNSRKSISIWKTIIKTAVIYIDPHYTITVTMLPV